MGCESHQPRPHRPTPQERSSHECAQTDPPIRCTPGAGRPRRPCRAEPTQPDQPESAALLGGPALARRATTRRRRPSGTARRHRPAASLPPARDHHHRPPPRQSGAVRHEPWVRWRRRPEHTRRVGRARAVRVDPRSDDPVSPDRLDPRTRDGRGSWRGTAGHPSVRNRGVQAGSPCAGGPRRRHRGGQVVRRPQQDRLLRAQGFRADRRRAGGAHRADPPPAPGSRCSCCGTASSWPAPCTRTPPCG